MVTFASIFQNRLTYDSTELMHVDQLMAACENVATAQVDVIPTRVTNIRKSVVKDIQLYNRPLIAVFDSKAYTAGGRHRITAIAEICEMYGVNAAGQLVEFTGDISDTALEKIEPLVSVEICYADSKATIGHMQLADNGSRSMTAAETNLVKATFAKLSALTSVQMQLARMIESSLGCTFNTALSVAKRISAAFPKMFVYSGTEQLDTLNSWLSDFYAEVLERSEEDELNQVVTGNFSRNYGKFIEAFLASHVETGEVDEDDEPLVETVQVLYGSSLEKPEKVAKSKSKSSELEAQLAAMTAQLQAQAAKLAEAGLA